MGSETSPINLVNGEYAAPENVSAERRRTSGTSIRPTSSAEEGWRSARVRTYLVRRVFTWGRGELFVEIILMRITKQPALMLSARMIRCYNLATAADKPLSPAAHDALTVSCQFL